MYQRDRQWSDQYLPAIRRVIGPYLLEPSTFDVDTREAGDLMIFRARDYKIACRVRRQGYADRYPYEFTIRSHRDSGAKTELRKLVDGCADWMLYAHAGDGGELSRWWLLDLAVWRAQLIRRTVKYQQKSNGDGTHFVAFDVRSFPSHFVIGASHDVQMAA